MKDADQPTTRRIDFRIVGLNAVLSGVFLGAGTVGTVGGPTMFQFLLAGSIAAICSTLVYGCVRGLARVYCPTLRALPDRQPTRDRTVRTDGSTAERR